MLEAMFPGIGGNERGIHTPAKTSGTFDCRTHEGRGVCRVWRKGCKLDSLDAHEIVQLAHRPRNYG
jgi:hypothetical protein